MEKKANEMVTKDTLEVLKKKGLKLKLNTAGKAKIEKYSRAKHLPIFRGYDLLENMMVVRQYIQKKHNIDLGLLETLLFLNPKQYFTQADYAEMPKQFRYCYLKNLLATGYVSLLQDAKDVSKKLYKVNRKGHEIVCNFYELLSCEKKINEIQSSNPFNHTKKRTPFDKKRMDLIKKINQLPAPESKKGLYQ
ncbi:MAG: hypothetical protein H7Y10_03555 [Flavobacterium sp.]|nr:hypothetical protein [Flavobacterium sp.]